MFGEVTADVLNIRSGPGTGFEIIGKLKLGDQVEASEKNIQWWHLTSVNGAPVTGWASGDYIQDTSAPDQWVVDVAAVYNSQVYSAKNITLTRE